MTSSHRPNRPSGESHPLPSPRAAGQSLPPPSRVSPRPPRSSGRPGPLASPWLRALLVRFASDGDGWWLSPPSAALAALRPRRGSDANNRRRAQTQSSRALFRCALVFVAGRGRAVRPQAISAKPSEAVAVETNQLIVDDEASTLRPHWSRAGHRPSARIPPG